MSKKIIAADAAGMAINVVEDEHFIKSFEREDGKCVMLFRVVLQKKILEVFALAESEQGAIDQAFTAEDISDDDTLSAVRVPFVIRGWGQHKF